MRKSLLIAAAALLLATPVLADTLPPEISFRAAISMGFQVVAVQTVPGTDAVEIGMKNPNSTTVVTLQRGVAVAVCAFTTKGWVYMQATEIDAATGCDVRDLSSATPPAAPAATTPPAAPADNGTAAPGAAAPAAGAAAPAGSGASAPAGSSPAPASSGSAPAGSGSAPPGSGSAPAGSRSAPAGSQ